MKKRTKRKFVCVSPNIGEKYGKLTVKNIFPMNGRGELSGKLLAECICDCGNNKITRVAYLKSGHTRSCGCLTKERKFDFEKLNANNPKHINKMQDPKLGSAMTVYKASYSDENISFEEFLKLSQLDCAYCGKPPSNRINPYANNEKYSIERRKNGWFIYNGLDKIDNDKGHSIDNVVPCCINCNRAKCKRGREEFLEWVKRVYDRCCS